MVEDGKVLYHDFSLVFRPVELEGERVKVSGKSFRVVLSPEQVPDNLESGALYEIHEEFYMKQTRLCGLHLMYLEGAYEEILGCKVEETSCPRNVDPNQLEVGHLYELRYDHYKMRGQLMARVSGLDPVEG